MVRCDIELVLFDVFVGFISTCLIRDLYNADLAQMFSRHRLWAFSYDGRAAPMSPVPTASCWLALCPLLQPRSLLWGVHLQAIIHVTPRLVIHSDSESGDGVVVSRETGWIKRRMKRDGWNLDH